MYNRLEADGRNIKKWNKEENTEPDREWKIKPESDGRLFAAIQRGVRRDFLFTNNITGPFQNYTLQ